MLTGDNTYAGGTTIASGILQLGDGGTTGSIVGNVADSGTLAFDRSDTMTFAGVISGSGAVSQIGSGTTILTADNPYTGGTNVSAGTLAVGDFAHPTAALSGGGPISVGSGGTLGGYGSVTGPTVNSGVIAAGSATPGFLGSPTGTFTIIGNLLNQGAIQLASGDEHRQCAGGSRQLLWRPAARWPSTLSWEATARPLTDWSSTAAPLPGTHRCT